MGSLTGLACVVPVAVGAVGLPGALGELASAPPVSGGVVRVASGLPSGAWRAVVTAGGCPGAVGGQVGNRGRRGDVGSLEVIERLLLGIGSISLPFPALLQASLPAELVLRVGQQPA
eukprot:2215047-Alexandrium_andersonii.AAC.1